MKYKVERHSPDGIDTVFVNAESGDEAAEKAYKPGCIIRGIVPADDEKPSRKVDA